MESLQEACAWNMGQWSHCPACLEAGHRREPWDHPSSKSWGKTEEGMRKQAANKQGCIFPYQPSIMENNRAHPSNLGCFSVVSLSSFPPWGIHVTAPGSSMFQCVLWNLCSAEGYINFIIYVNGAGFPLWNLEKIIHTVVAEQQAYPN